MLSRQKCFLKLSVLLDGTCISGICISGICISGICISGICISGIWRQVNVVYTLFHNKVQ